MLDGANLYRMIKIGLVSLIGTVLINACFAAHEALFDNNALLSAYYAEHQLLERLKLPVNTTKDVVFTSKLYPLHMRWNIRELLRSSQQDAGYIRRESVFAHNMLLYRARANTLSLHPSIMIYCPIEVLLSQGNLQHSLDPLERGLSIPLLSGFLYLNCFPSMIWGNFKDNPSYITLGYSVVPFGLHAIHNRQMTLLSEHLQGTGLSTRPIIVPVRAIGGSMGFKAFALGPGNLKANIFFPMPFSIFHSACNLHYQILQNDTLYSIGGGYATVGLYNKHPNKRIPILCNNYIFIDKHKGSLLIEGFYGVQNDFRFSAISYVEAAYRFLLKEYSTTLTACSSYGWNAEPISLSHTYLALFLRFKLNAYIAVSTGHRYHWNLPSGWRYRGIVALEYQVIS
jgi:hypothetical protein